MARPMPGWKALEDVVAARMRRDLTPLRPGDTLTTELQLLTSRRADLVADRTRAINRLRGLLTGIFPALERALDLTRTGPLVLLGGYQTPAALRAISAADLTAWLRDRKVRGADQLAAAAVAAAHQQSVALPGETLAAQLVATLAGEVVALNGQVRDLDELIEGRFHRHQLAPVVASLPGIGTLLGAAFLAATGGDMAYFGTPDRLAAFAGLAPDPGTLDPSAATCTAPGATTAACSASSTTPPWSASAAVGSPAASMTASGPRANATPRPCWPWPDGASRSCGRWWATSGPTGQHHPPTTPPDPLTGHHTDGLTPALGSSMSHRESISCPSVSATTSATRCGESS